MYFAVEECGYVNLEQLVSDMLASADLNWMALVDGAFDLQSRKVPDWPKKEFLFNYAGFEDVVQASPFLLQLETHSAEALKRQLRKLIKHRSNRPMLSLLSSKHSVHDICLRWRDFVNVSVVDDQDLILRFADTRILEILPSCLSPGNWSRLSNMLENWIYFDRQGRLSAVLPKNAEYVDEKKVELSREEFGCLIDRCEPDAIINFLYKNQTELLDNCAPYFAYQRAKAVSEYCRHYRVDRFPDVVALVTFDLVSNIPVEQNIALKDLLVSDIWNPGNLIDHLIFMVE